MRKKVIEIETIKKPIKNARFIVRGGNYNPIGYRCGDIEIMRTYGETLEELRARCRGGVEWPDDSTIHTFIPL